MSDISKYYIGKEDFQIQTNTGAAETFERKTSVGGTMNLTKIPDIWDGTGKIDISEIVSDTGTITDLEVTTITTPATDPGDITETVALGTLTHDVLKDKINEILAALRIADFFT